MEIQYSQLEINHLNNTPSTKAAGGGIFSGVFQQGRQGTSQGQEDFELSWYLFFQQCSTSKAQATQNSSDRQSNQDDYQPGEAASGNQY